MVLELSPEAVADRMAKDAARVLLLDVREPLERRLAVIEPSVHIPMGELPMRVDELPRDRDLIVYCHTGIRSAVVAGFLESRGFASVANLEGGIDAWSVLVDPDVPRYW